MPRAAERRVSLADLRLAPSGLFERKQAEWIAFLLQRLEEELERASNRTERSLFSLVAGGVDNRAPAPLAIVPGGAGAMAYLHGMQARAAGPFLAMGDAQAFDLIWRGVTSNGSATEIFLDGTALRAELDPVATWAFQGIVAARRIDAAAESAAYQVAGLIHRDGAAATTELVGSIAKTLIGEDNAAWDVTVDADTTNGALRIQVTGEAAKTVRWVAHLSGIQIKD